MPRSIKPIAQQPFKRQLQHYRTKMGMTPNDLARALQTLLSPVSAEQIAQWERGENLEAIRPIPIMLMNDLFAGEIEKWEIWKSHKTKSMAEFEARDTFLLTLDEALDNTHLATELLRRGFGELLQRRREECGFATPQALADAIAPQHSLSSGRYQRH